MRSLEHLRDQCEHLLQEGSLPRSACGAALQSLLRPLLHAGAIVEERSGAGRRLVVRDTHTVRAFVRQRFPNAPVFAGASDRVVSVAGFRNSKILPGEAPEIVNLRAWQPGLVRRDTQAVDADAATAAHGVFSFVLGTDAAYTLHGPCALVENLAVLLHYERLNLPDGLALWSRGRMSGRMLDWLAGQTGREFALRHLPDYDPVGLGEFVRLRHRLGPRVQLHIPPDLPERFQRFANRELLDKANNRALLANLRRSSDPEVRHVLALIDQHNAVLEQESLLV